MQSFAGERLWCINFWILLCYTVMRIVFVIQGLIGLVYSIVSQNNVPRAFCLANVWLNDCASLRVHRIIPESSINNLTRGKSIYCLAVGGASFDFGEAGQQSDRNNLFIERLRRKTIHYINHWRRPLIIRGLLEPLPCDQSTPAQSSFCQLFPMFRLQSPLPFLGRVCQWWNNP